MNQDLSLSIEQLPFDEEGVLEWQSKVPPWAPGRRELAEAFVPLKPTEGRPSQLRRFEVGGYRPAESRRSSFQGTPEPALRLCADLARRLAILHDHGLVYGRISPATVWVSQDVDGVALLPLKPFEEGVSPSVHQQQLGSVEEQDFAAPDLREQLTVFPSRSTDLFSLGAFLFWACTGRTRLPKKTNKSDLADFPAPISQTVSDIVDRLRGTDSGPRYGTARGVEADIRQCLRELQSDTPRAPIILGQQDDAPSLVFGSTLVGRDAELGILMDSTRAARQKAVAVLITGPPGVGKTRLVDEFERFVRSQHGVFVAGKSDQFAMEEPLSSLTKSLGSLACWATSRPASTRKRLLAKVRSELTGLEPVISTLSADFEKFLGIQASMPELGLKQRGTRLKDAVVAVLRAFTSKMRPLCIFLDDMQWADEATVELMETLFSDPTLAELFFIGAFRDNEQSYRNAIGTASAVLGKVHSLTVVELHPLKQKEITDIIAENMAIEPGAAMPLGSFCFKKTGGNPLYLRQVIDSLHAKKLLIFDFVSEKWLWDIDKILRQDADGDVAGIISE